MCACVCKCVCVFDKNYICVLEDNGCHPQVSASCVCGCFRHKNICVLEDNGYHPHQNESPVVLWKATYVL